MYDSGGCVVIGGWLVSIDKSAKKITLPQDMLYMSPDVLDGGAFEELELNDVWAHSMLPGEEIHSGAAAKEGLRLILNILDAKAVFDEGNACQNPCLYSNLHVREFFVPDSSRAFRSVDGLLYSHDGKTLLRCPPLRRGVVEIPEGVENINCNAFLDVCLDGVVIPSTVKYLDMRAFNGASIKRLEYAEGATYVGAGISLPSVEKLVIPGSVECVPNHFAESTEIQELELGEGVKIIGERAFREFACVHVKLPRSIVRVNRGNFCSASYIEMEKPVCGILRAAAYSCRSKPLAICVGGFSFVLPGNLKADKAFQEFERKWESGIVDKAAAGNLYACTSSSISKHEAAIVEYKLAPENGQLQKFLARMAHGIALEYVYGSLGNLEIGDFLYFLGCHFLNAEKLRDLISVCEEEGLDELKAYFLDELQAVGRQAKKIRL